MLDFRKWLLNELLRLKLLNHDRQAKSEVNPWRYLRNLLSFRCLFCKSTSVVWSNKVRKICVGR
jgi:hypothetical protein